MHHFFVEDSQVNGSKILINGSDVNHIKNVLRVKLGEEILVSDTKGWDYYCTVTEIRDDEVEVNVRFFEEAGHELPSKICLFQGLPKGDKMELIIQKAVELGVVEVIPVSMKRSVVKIDAKKAETKARRWVAISESAAKQSKRSIVPAVHMPMTFSQAVEYAKEFDVVLVPYEMEKGMEATKEILDKIGKDQKIGVFIGPEGGFDEEEIVQVKAAGFTPITLGKRILRTETAGLVALSVLMMHLEQQA